MTKLLSIIVISLIMLVLIPHATFGEDTPIETDGTQSENETISIESSDLNTSSLTLIADTGANNISTNTTHPGPPDQGETITANSSVPANNQTGPSFADIQKAYTGWYLKGVNASAAGKYQSASEAFAAALRLDKGSEEAEIGYATALSKLGRSAEALEIFTKVQNQSPTNTSILIPLGREQNAVGRHLEALATLQNATIQYPNDPEGWNQLAAAYAGLYRYEEALTTVRRSLLLSLNQAGSWGELGAILSGQGRFYEAIPSFEKGLTLDPNDVTIRKDLGDTWIALSQYEQAAFAYEAATEIRPADTSLWIRLGEIYEKQGNTTKAAEAYRKGGLINQTQAETNSTSIEDQITALNTTLPKLSEENAGNITGD
ncbi:MAG: tetratricopeptide repeat protein [Methanobacteriota archaeon]